MRSGSGHGSASFVIIFATICVTLAPENGGAGQHLVEDDPEREEVRALVERAPERLFRREVVERSDDHALARVARAFAAVPRALEEDLAEAEVQELRPPVGRQG